MALEESSFLSQAERVREKIKAKFSLSHQVLHERESALCLELDQLVATYKGEGVRKQIEELNLLKVHLKSSVKLSENKEAVEKSIAPLDASIRELEVSLETAKDRMRGVELEWDEELEERLSAIGAIRIITKDCSDYTSKKFDEKEKAKSDLEGKCEEYKQKYTEAKKESQLLIKLREVEGELSGLRNAQIVPPIPYYPELGDDKGLGVKKMTVVKDAKNSFGSKQSGFQTRDVLASNPFAPVPLPYDEMKDLQISFQIGTNVPRSISSPHVVNDIGLESYDPDVLDIIQNKTSHILYKSQVVKVINLSYLRKPESHKNKQILVKTNNLYRMGYLQVVFSKRHPHGKYEMFAGIKLQDPLGDSNGVYESVRYFYCGTNYAVFIRISEVYVHFI